MVAIGKNYLIFSIVLKGSNFDFWFVIKWVNRESISSTFISSSSVTNFDLMLFGTILKAEK